MAAAADTRGASYSFAAATEALDDGIPVVSVTGEVDLATAPALTQSLVAVVEDWTGEVIVDLTDCGFIDAQGLRALVSTRARLESSKRALVLVVSNPSVLRVFEITKVDELFNMYDSLDAAVDGRRTHNGCGRLS